MQSAVTSTIATIPPIPTTLTIPATTVTDTSTMKATTPTTTSTTTTDIMTTTTSTTTTTAPTLATKAPEKRLVGLLLCTLRSGFSSGAFIFPDDGLCAITTFNSLLGSGGNRLTPPYKQDFITFLKTASGHSKTEYGIGIDHDAVPRPPTGLKRVVEGHTISEEEWSDDSRQSPGNRRNDADENFKTKPTLFFNRVCRECSRHCIGKPTRGPRSAKWRDSKSRSHARHPKSHSAQRQDSRPSSHYQNPRSNSARRSPSVSRPSSRGPGEASKLVASLRGPPASLLFPDLRMGCKKTSHLLRHRLDPGSSKTAACKQLAQIVHQYSGKDEELLEELITRYINRSPKQSSTEQLPEYTGTADQQLDADISESEVAHMRVLALIERTDHHNNITLDRLTVIVKQTAHLISRMISQLMKHKANMERQPSYTILHYPLLHESMAADVAEGLLIHPVDLFVAIGYTAYKDYRMKDCRFVPPVLYSTELLDPSALHGTYPIRLVS
ncbi:hypothetical protein HPB51_027176 [Rhipicephalus microplus]|uniref:Uncharacterized protein n=1 Tax=Rhipicephalus microplus TaxID=6941 RepID=A0A9J6D102_RHIMP|nr:hypothetical protein HPB51_027176 [Rhipicephalus microplus]